MDAEPQGPATPDLDAENQRLREGLEALNARLGSKRRQDRGAADQLTRLQREAARLAQAESLHGRDGTLLVPDPSAGHTLPGTTVAD